VARFAEYQPDRHGAAPSPGLRTRLATAGDVPHLARLQAQRDDIPEASARANFERLLRRMDEGDAAVFVADVADEVAGYGTVDHLERVGLPPGWYLGGVVVAPEHRRRGIGARLTRERLAWISARAREAYYFVNSANRVSLDLHAPFGFREIARDLAGPGLTFTGGSGLLFRADLPLRSSAGDAVSPPTDSGPSGPRRRAGGPLPRPPSA
jgi:GNAT superfamily N-acetyltransferase